MQASWRPEPGTILAGRYTLERVLGVGPTGAVYAATDGRAVDPDRAAVAVKVFHPAFFSSGRRGPNAMRIQRARAYTDPSLPTIRDVVVTDVVAFVVTQLLTEPMPLERWVLGRMPLATEQVSDLMEPIAGAIAAIHLIGVAGNLKPSNVFVGVEGEVVVTDPWFLGGRSEVGPGELPERSEHWLAPEQREESWTERPETDVFRLGLMLGWLLAGRTVVGGRSLARQRVTVPRAVDAVFTKATARAVEDRYPDVARFRASLAAAWAAGESDPDEPAVAESIAGLSLAGPAIAGQSVVGDASQHAPMVAVGHGTAATPPAGSAAIPEVSAVEPLGDDGFEPIEDLEIIEESVVGFDGELIPVPLGGVEGLAGGLEHFGGTLDRASALPGAGLASIGSAPEPDASMDDRVIGNETEAIPLHEIMAMGLDPSLDSSAFEVEAVVYPDGVTESVELDGDDLVELTDDTLLLDTSSAELERATVNLGARGPVVSAAGPLMGRSGPLDLPGPGGVGTFDPGAADSTRTVQVTPGPGSARALEAARVADGRRRAEGLTGSAVPAPPPAKARAQDEEERRSAIVWVAPLLVVIAALFMFWVLGEVSRQRQVTAQEVPAAAQAEPIEGQAVRASSGVPGVRATEPAGMPGADGGSPGTGPSGTASADPDGTAPTATGEEPDAEGAEPDRDAQAAGAAAAPGTVAGAALGAIPDAAPSPAPAVDPAASPEAEGDVESESPSDDDEPDAGPAGGAVAATAEADPGVPADMESADYKCPGGMSRVRGSRTFKTGDGESVRRKVVWCIDRHEYPGKDQVPQTNVSIAQAKGICKARGRRLCTRSEWRGGCGGKYPYQGDYEPGRCNTVGTDGMPKPVLPAGSRPACRGGFGTYDMVGNVAEWTSDGAVNGGSAYKDGESASCYRSGRRTGGSPYVGFRCCADPTPVTESDPAADE